MREGRTSIGSRVISALLVLCMVLSMIPATAMPVFAAPSTATAQTNTNVEAIRDYAAGLLEDNFSKAGTNSDLSWTTETGKGDNWRYYTGVMMDAMLMLGMNSDSNVTNSTGNALEFVQNYMDFNIDDSGKITEWHANELDSVPPALALLAVLDSVQVDEAHRADYETALNYVYDELEGSSTSKQTSYPACGGNLLHKDSWTTWNIGLDGIYMAQPFLARYANALASGKITNDDADPNAIFKNIRDRLVWVSEGMYDESTGLFHHGWNVSKGEGNGVFWSRGIAWYAVGLVLVIDEMPEGQYKQDLIATLPRLFDGMMRYQDADTGMWYNIVNTTEKVVTSGDYKDNYNRLETSGSGLMAYAMMKAYNEGWVGSTYGEAGLKAFNGVVSNKLKDGKLTDIYKQSSVESTQEGYCKHPYVSDEAKGSGGVLMAASVANETAAKLNNDSTYFDGEDFTIGVVSAPEMTIAEGASIDGTGIKATLVGNQGTVTNVSGKALSYEVGDASNGKATVTVKNGDVAIAAFEVNVVDTSGTQKDSGTISVPTQATDTPTAPSVTAGSWIEINKGGDGATTYNQYFGTTIESGTYLIVDEGYAMSTGSVGSNKSGKPGAVAVTIDSTNKTASFASGTDASPCLWTISKNDDGSYQFMCVYNSTTYYVRVDSSYITSKTGEPIDVPVVTTDAANGNYQIDVGSSQYIYYSSGFGRNGSGSVNLYKQTAGSSGDAKYAKLNGTATYAYAVGTETDILAQIQSDYAIQTSTSSDGSNPADVAWDNSSVTYTWVTTLDVTKAGTYTLSVKVDGKEIGTIPVLIYGDTVDVTYDVDLAVSPSALLLNTNSYSSSLTVNSDVKNSGGTSVGTVGTGYTVTSDNTDVITVNGTYYTVVGAGEANITVTADTAYLWADSSKTYAVSNASVTIPVIVTEVITEEPVTHSLVSAVAAPSTIEVGDTATIVPYAVASDGSAGYTYGFNYWISSGGEFASLNGNVLTANATGTVVVGVTLNSVNGGYYNDTKYVTVTIVEASGEEPEETTEPEPDYTYTILGSNGSALAGQNITLNEGDTYTPSFSVSDGTNDVTGSYTMTLEATSNASAVSISGTTITANTVNTETVVGIRATVTPNSRAAASGTSVDFTVTVKAATTSGYTYTLDTDGVIEDDSDYLIVGLVNGVYYALTINGSSMTSTEVSPSQGVITLTEDVAAKTEFHFANTGDFAAANGITYGSFKITNGDYYLNDGGASFTTTEKVSYTAKIGASDGTYQIVLKMQSNYPRDLVCGGNSWSRADPYKGDDQPNVLYLYKKGDATPEPSYTYTYQLFAPDGTTEISNYTTFNIEVGDTWTPVVKVTRNDGVDVSSQYTVNITSNNTATVTFSGNTATGAATGSAGINVYVADSNGTQVQAWESKIGLNVTAAAPVTYTGTITFNSDTMTMTEAQAHTKADYTVTVTDSNGNTVTPDSYTLVWSLANGYPTGISGDNKDFDCITVTSDGIVSAVDAAIENGETTMTATLTAIVVNGVPYDIADVSDTIAVTVTEDSSVFVQSPTAIGSGSSAYYPLSTTAQSWTFTSRSYATARGNYDSAIIEIWSGSSNGTWELTARSDNWAWSYLADPQSQYSSVAPSNWDTWLEGNKFDGATVTVTAQLVNDYIVVGITSVANGQTATSVYRLAKKAADGETISLRFTGEQCTLINLQTTSNGVDISSAVADSQVSSYALSYTSKNVENGGTVDLSDLQLNITYANGDVITKNVSTGYNGLLLDSEDIAEIDTTVAGNYDVNIAYKPDGTNSLYNSNVTVTVAAADTPSTGNKYIHNFSTSADGMTDADGYFTIDGNKTDNDGTIDGTTYDQGLKLQSSSGTVTFTAANPGTLTLHVGNNATTVKINGTAQPVTDGVVTVELAAGAYTIARGDDEGYLYYIEFAEEGSGSAEPDPDEPTIESFTLGVTQVTISESDIDDKGYVSLDALKAAIRAASGLDKDTVTLSWTYSDGTTGSAELVLGAGQNIPLYVSAHSNGARYLGVWYNDLGYTGEIGVTVEADSSTTASTYIHNFTEHNKASEFYTITGDLSTSKGSVSYNGETLTQCLKMESSTSIAFTAENSGKLTLVFGGSTDAAGKSVKIDGVTHTIGDDGTLTVDLAAGDHTITKGDSIFLFYMAYAEEGSTGGSGSGSGSTGGTTTVSYELFTGDPSTIENGDIFLIISSDQKLALMNDSDGESGSIAGLSANVTISGNYATIGSSDETYAIWTVSDVTLSSKSAGAVYSMRFGNGKRYLRDGDDILGSSGKALYVLKTDTNGLYVLNSGVDSNCEPNGKYWYYDGSAWTRTSSTAGYVYLYKQTTFTAGVSVANPGTLYIGASSSMPTADLTETVMHDGSTLDTDDYSITWSLVSGGDYIELNSSTGEVTAKKGGTATVRATVTIGQGDSAVTYTTDVAVTVANPSITVTEEISLIHGAEEDLGKETIATSVYANNSKTSDYKVTYTSSNTNVATVDSDGNVTAVGEGTAVISAMLTEVNGLTVTSLGVNATTEVTVTEKAVSTAYLNAYDYIVIHDASNEQLQNVLKHMVLTVNYNTGEQIVAQYGTDANLTVDVSGVNTAEPGIQYATVIYKDANGKEIFRDTIWIHVEAFDPSKYDGIVIKEENVTYTLDIDGINVNHEYVIAANGYNVALLNPSATETSCGAAINAAVTINGNVLTIGAGDAPLAAWLFDTAVDVTIGSATVKQYNASNFLRYLGIDDDMLLIHHNVEHVYVNHVDNGEYQIILSYKADGTPEYYLTYNGSAWTATTTESSVYLYHKDATYQDYTLNFELAPTETSIPEGKVTAIVPTIKYNDDTITLDASRYQIVWSSSNDGIATVDQNGNVTGISEGTVTITAMLVTVDGFEVIDNETDEPYIIETASVTVVDANPTPVLTPPSLIIGVGSVPNLNKVNVRMTYGAESSYDYDVTHELLTFNLADAEGELADGTKVTGFSSEAPGTFIVEVVYAGQSFDLTIIVDEDPYAGLDTADSIPGYPDAGAVRMEKTAAGVIDFNSTGVVQLELTAAGISTKSSVDVVLIVDVSNSMAWSMDWFNGLSDEQVEDARDPAKIPAVNDDNTISGTTKLDMAMKSASNFADILLNVEGGDNTLTFVTFAGNNDSEYGGLSGNMDSVRTPFVGVTDYNTAKGVFDATKFTHLVAGDSSVQYYLDIGGSTANGYGDEAISSGYGSKDDPLENRGNTNYDYAYGEATQAVADLKAQYAANNNGADYDKSGRQLYVVFMTDGAPSAYNGIYLNGKDSDTMYANTMGNGDKDVGKTYDSSDDANNESEWLTHIKKYHHLATALEEEIYAYYTVGFDLAHGGFGDYSWGEDDMERVLAGMVKNSVVPVTMATDETQLNDFYTNLAKALAYAGTNAKVTDQIGNKFSLFTGTHMYADNIEELTAGTDHELTSATLQQMGAMEFDVQILAYRLVLASDIGDELEVIQTNGDVEMVTIEQKHLGLRVNEDPQVVETISFVYDETANTTYAYSDVIGDDVNILKTNVTRKSLVPNADGDYEQVTYETVIEAQYFTYGSRDVTVDGKTVSEESIEWKIGNITDREIAMSYYAYLEGSLDGANVSEGMYQTNEFAYLEYIDVYGDYVKRDYGVPQVAWGKAGVTVRFYLVDKNGNFVNRAGVIFTNAANRIILTERTNYDTDLNNCADEEQLIIEALDALIAAGLSSYELYDPALKLEVTTDYANKVLGGVDIESFSKENIGNLVFINDVMGDRSYVNTIIDIPVILTNLGSSEQPLTDKTVVMDYGKPIEIDPFNEVEARYASGYAAPDATTGEIFWYTMEVVGFAKYSSTQDMYAYVPESNVSASLTTANGTYALGEKSDKGIVETVIFTPNGFLDEVEKVFVAVRFDKWVYTNGGKGAATEDYYYMYKLVNVVPASVMYYETEGNVAGEITTTGIWNSTGNAESGNQDMYKNNVAYGYDSTYGNDTALSNGSSLLASGEGVNQTTATFTFTGTGFEIISRTGKDQATIRVQVKDTEGNVVKKVSVINKGANELYQIPVVSVTGLDFGTYTVEIGVYQGYTPNPNLGLSPEVIEQVTRGNEFYFDAIRIYDPIVTSAQVTPAGTDSTGADKKEVTVADLYKGDNEYAPEITQIGQLIVDLSDYESLGGGATGSGAIFMDAFSLPESTNGYTSSSMVSDYDSFGPNNEVYLSNGQGVAFTLNIGDTIPASLQIGAKSITGGSVTLNAAVIDVDNSANREPLAKEITSNTAMFYAIASGTTLEGIFGDNGKVNVVIWNTSGNVLSLTDIKITYNEEPDVPVDYEYSNKLVNDVYSDLANTNCSLRKEDGVWYYCNVAGEVVTDYTGLVTTADVGTWYVANGQIDFGYNNLYTDANGDTYYISGGSVASNLNGLAKRAGQWLYFSNGKVDTTYEGLVSYNGTWYVVGGSVAFNYTGLYTDANGNTYYIRYGQHATTYSGLVNCGSGVWKYVDQGMLSTTYTGLAKNATGWWYVKDGVVDTTYTGLATNATGTWYIKYGQVSTKFSGNVKIDGVTYTIQNGLVTSSTES